MSYMLIINFPHLDSVLGLPLTLVSILISSDYITNHEVILDVAE